MLGIDDIKQKLTVRVNEGTGVLVSPLDKDILYVFTCRHVVLDEGNNILPLDKITISYDEINNLLAELKNRLKISIFLWRKKLCISLIFSNFVVSNYKVIYFTLCTTCMQIS